MILQADAKQLEWVCASFLSQDLVACSEILAGFDQHADNQKRFNLPSRLVAKTFLFRIIYGGSGSSFAIDPEFGYLGGEEWWDEKIAAFYAKYPGLYAWHARLYERTCLDHGRLSLPTGRSFQFQPYTYQGVTKYPRTKILNYPVQSLAADIMAIARVSLYKRLLSPRWYLGPLPLWVNTVHDSIVLDIPAKMWYTGTTKDDLLWLFRSVFADIPENFHKLFGVEFNLPIRVEIATGDDWKHLTVIGDSNGGCK